MSFCIDFLLEYEASTSSTRTHFNENILQHSNAILQFDGKTLFDHL